MILHFNYTPPHTMFCQVGNAFFAISLAMGMIYHLPLSYRDSEKIFLFFFLNFCDISAHDRINNFAEGRFVYIKVVEMQIEPIPIFRLNGIEFFYCTGKQFAGSAAIIRSFLGTGDIFMRKISAMTRSSFPRCDKAKL